MSQPATASALIIAVTAIHFGTPQIVERDRSKTTAHARQIALYICRSYIRPTPSYPELGRWFNRDHTTVMHAVRRIEWMRSRDHAVEQAIKAIRSEVTRRLADRAT